MNRRSRTIRALRQIADALDADNARTSAQRGGDPLGYGWGMIDRLTRRACAGTTAEFTAEWGRLAEEQGIDAAKAFGEEIWQARRAVQAALDGGRGRTSHDDVLQPDEIRAIADQLARQATPLPGEDPR